MVYYYSIKENYGLAMFLKIFVELFSFGSIYIMQIRKATIHDAETIAKVHVDS
ncbi:hypothetical protein [Bacillus thuringiensis]|uniref:hypothetical protein n=1 Tax=Bacillus thuringiensis TaxID=1428 RepID=UPI0030F39F64